MKIKNHKFIKSLFLILFTICLFNKNVAEASSNRILNIKYNEELVDLYTNDINKNFNIIEKNNNNFEYNLKFIPFALVPDDMSGKVYDGKAWKKSKKTYDGKLGYYITQYQWISADRMRGYGRYVLAQRKAVIKKYGEILNDRLYKMETTQLISQSATQTQGYITVSVDAICHGITYK